MEMIMRAANAQITKQLLSFGLIGIGNTAVDFATYATLTRAFAVPTLWAFTIGFVIANIQSYILNSRFTFSHAKTTEHHYRFLKFISVSAVSLALNMCIFSGLHYWLGWHDLASKLIATALIVLFSFMVQRMFTFKVML